MELKTTEAVPTATDIDLSDTQARPRTPTIEPKATVPQLQRRSFEHWARQKGVPPIQLNGVRALKRWAQGRELTEAEFDQALTEHGALVFRRHIPRPKTRR